MKRIAIATCLAALAAIASGNTNLPPQATNTLTPIDTVPTRQQIDNAFGDSPQMALQNLAALATDTDPANDVGIRLRAIHALAKYCTSTPCADTDVAHQSLADVIAANKDETSGSNVLLLRAAVETIGSMRVGTDVDELSVLLDHPSRDVRASAARALQELCTAHTAAVTALRLRYSRELTEQVKLAISEALRVLEQCTN